MCKNNNIEAMKKTVKQRQLEILPVIQKLNSMHIKPTLNENIKAFYIQLQDFINNGSLIKIDIPIEELNIRIIGVLEENINKKTWLKMTALEKNNE